MIVDMPRTRPLHLVRETSRHGKVKWYFRRGHGPRIDLAAAYGTKEFWQNYEAALHGQTQPAQTTHKRLSLAWCIEQYMNSRSWQVLAPESRKQMSYQMQRISENAGAADIRELTRKHIIEGKERRAHVPSDANKYVRAMGLLCRFCVDAEWISASPVHGIGKLKTGDGFYTWTADDFAKFEARWPVGTMQRLAYEIYLNTGLRRGDVHKFGRQHIRGGVYTVTTGKTGRVVESNLTPRLAHVMAETKCGSMTLLLSGLGIPFASAASLGNWFGDACKESGVEGNAHGIRKGLACVLAEKNLTEAQLNSFFGWSHHSKESATYIDKANRAKMAKQGSNVISRTFKTVRD